MQLLILTGSVLVSNLLERRRDAAVTLAMLPDDGTDSKVRRRNSYSDALAQTIQQNGVWKAIILNVYQIKRSNYANWNEMNILYWY